MLRRNAKWNRLSDKCCKITWKNNFYPDPLIAMLYSIHDELERKCRCEGKLRFKQRMQLKQALKETVKEKANEKYEITTSTSRS